MFTKFYSRWKFTILLAAALLVIGTRLALPGSAAEEVLLDLVGVVFLIAGLVTLCDDRRHRLAALLLGCPAILLGVVSHAFPREVAGTVHLLGRVSATLFLGFTVTVLVRAVVAARSVTWDTISAALVGYVMIGIVWTQIYCALELTQPGSFAIASSAADQLDDTTQRQAILEYFSFATLSTLGYGDVTPVSRPARSLACLEAIGGQFYLAVLVAGLVGMRGVRQDPPS
jgi:hypothetical protein